MPSNGIQRKSFTNSLNKVDSYLGKVKYLPSADEFQKNIEESFWQALTQKKDPSESYKYNELPNRVHSLIGTYDTEDGQTEPWWLREFKWQASFGDESIILRGEGLEIFESKFDRENTILHRPEFGNSIDPRPVVKALKGLNEVPNLLDVHVGERGENSNLKLPNDLFTVSEGLVEPTDAFGRWLDEFLQLVPGVGAEPTALYLACTGTSEDSVESSALSEDLYTSLHRLGLIQERSTQSKLVRQFDKVLQLSRVFNRVIPCPQTYDTLSGLQYQLYNAFIETTDLSDDFAEELIDSATRGHISKLEDGERGLFSRVACGAPIILESNRPVLMSVSTTYPKRSSVLNYGSQEYRDLRSLFEAHGWFDDE